MNRKLLVTLLQKNIQELELITQGFMEMSEYPMPIIVLAQRKIDDIQQYIKELSLLKGEESAIEVNELVPVEQIAIENDIELADNMENVKVEFENAIASTIILSEKLIEEDMVEKVAEEVANDQIEVDEITEVLIVETIEEVDVLEFAEENNEKEHFQIIADSDQEKISESEKPTQEEVRKTILGERNSATIHTRNETLSKSDNSISAILANKKTTDIKQAINIGDRFRFQRELFRANGEDMNKTLTYINQLASLEEALSFLRSKYGWAAENEAAEDFYQIVRRRFIQ